MKKIKYSNIVFSFDIETTTTNNCVLHYLSSFAYVNFDAANDIKDIHLIRYCRTVTDVNNFLNKLSKYSDETFIIYCHNLAYEFDFLIKNVDFVKNNFSNDNSLFIKSRVPLFFKVCNIEFRCSYKLFNKSLKMLGELYNYPKLDLDYSKKYYEFSKLPKVEYMYNKRDVKIVLYAILNLKKEYDFISCVNDIPYTSTSIVRKSNEYINTKEDLQDLIAYCHKQHYYTKDYITFLKKIFTGGYTHSNVLYAMKILNNVYSFDIISSYLFVLYFCEFPNYFHKYTKNYKTQYFKKLINQDNYLEHIEHFGKSFKHHFLVEITLKNVKAKELNNNIILPISLSKCENVKNIVIDNGRILSAKKLTIFINEVDYYCISLFYDFEIYEVLTLHTSNYAKNAPEFIRNSVKQWAIEKTVFKRIVKKLDNNKKIEKGDLMYNGKYIIKISDDILAKDVVFYTTLLMNAKNKLNGLYGINVQELIPVKECYNLTDDSYYSIDGEMPKTFKRDYIIGLYTTSYARLNLFLWARFMIDRGHQLIYSDTDSWKCLQGNSDILADNIEYNNLLSTNVDNKNLFNFGCFDFEDKYDNFITLGCKKYIYTKNNEVKCTIAGINKFKYKECLNYFYKLFDYDFELLVNVCFSPKTYIDNSVINKLESHYQNNLVDSTFTDETGKTERVKAINMVDLRPIGSTILDYTPDTNRYIKLIEDKQNRLVENYPTILYKKDDKYFYKCVSDEDFTLYKKGKKKID